VFVAAGAVVVCYVPLIPKCLELLKYISYNRFNASLRLDLYINNGYTNVI